MPLEKPLQSAHILVPRDGLPTLGGRPFAGRDIGCALVTPDSLQCDFGDPKKTVGADSWRIETRKGLSLALSRQAVDGGFLLGVDSQINGVVVPDELWKQFLQGRGIGSNGLWVGDLESAVRILTNMSRQEVTRFGTRAGTTWCGRGFQAAR